MIENKNITHGYSIENLGGEIKVCTSKDHTFGTDSFLLSDFAPVRRKDIVCDFCTGCGIVALLWFRDENAPKKAYAVELQADAYKQLKSSVEISQLTDKLIPLHSDLKDLQGKITSGSLDVITCNPPYKAVNTGILSQKESSVTARHETDCTLDDVCLSASKLLKFGGKLCICQLPERLPDAISAMRKYKIEPKRLRFVQKNSNSAPWLFLLEGRLGSKPFLNVMAPLIMENEDKTSSDEIKRIYSMYGKVNK